MQDEGRIARMADNAISPQPVECFEVEQEVLWQSVGGSASPHPQAYTPPTISGPIAPMYGPLLYPAQLLSLPQSFYPQPQGRISLQNVSGTNISFNSFPSPPPLIHNVNSGNISNLSISNANNNNAKCVYPPLF